MGELDDERAEEKKKELMGSLREGLSKQGFDNPLISDIEHRIFSSGVKISAPEKPEMSTHFMTMNSFNSKAKTTKPGNIRMNLANLLVAIGSGGLTYVSALSYPWLYLVGFIILWKQLWDCATVEVGEKETKVLWAIWELNKNRQQIIFDNIYTKVNSISQQYQVDELRKGDVEVALNNLEKIETIAKTRDSQEEWRIVEWIKVSYR